MLASYGLPHRDGGMLFFAATTGPEELARAGARHAQRSFAALGIDAALVADDASATFNLLDRSGAETLIAMTFPRHDPGAIERAHAALDALHRRFRSAGFALHRSDIDHQRPEDLYDDPARLDLLRRLKAVLDPSGRLSPGRYGLGGR